MSESVRIPDKLYFRIGEVSDLTGIKPYVLRYWETEFDIVKPTKTPKNQRLYKRKEVELIFEIKRLLYEEKFTIAGAKKVMHEKFRTRAEDQLPLNFQDEKSHEFLVQLRKEILSIKELVEKG